MEGHLRLLRGAVEIASVLAGVGLALLLYVVLVKIHARLVVKSQPRTPMFECSKHGVFAEKHVIHHLDQKVCPYCWNERIGVHLDSTVVSK